MKEPIETSMPIPDRLQARVDHHARPGPDALVFAFAEGRMLVETGPEQARVPTFGELEAAAREWSTPIFLGSLGSRDCFVLPLEGGAEPSSSHALLGLRDLFGRLPDPLMSLAGRASQTLEWYLAHAYCGRCGTPTTLSETELARHCPACGALHFPRITPAVIMLVQRGDQVLLARNRNFRGGFHSVLAGFVELGETLEEAVAREIHEEVGVEVDRIRYFGSQSWPFPSQLMIGFTAHHRAGEIVLQPSEIMEAAWFGAGALPPLPGSFSIARRLVEDFLARHGQVAGR